MDEQQHDLPQQEHAHAFNGSLPSSPQPKSSTSLAIALVVSAVLLLAAISIAAWLMTRSGSTTTVNKQNGDGSASVKTVSFVAPSDIPASYVKTDENTQTAQTTSYFDANAACRIVTSVNPATDQDIKAAIIASLDSLKATGIATSATAAGNDYTVADTDGSHHYTFASVTAEQDVNVPGVSFSHQKGIAAYKQFGALFASITVTCKDDSWEARKTDLEALIQHFKVKTER
jgi:flagellar basal body-associated protein FliL